MLYLLSVVIRESELLLFRFVELNGIQKILNIFVQISAINVRKRCLTIMVDIHDHINNNDLINSLNFQLVSDWCIQLANTLTQIENGFVLIDYKEKILLLLYNLNITSCTNDLIKSSWLEREKLDIKDNLPDYFKLIDRILN